MLAAPHGMMKSVSQEPAVSRLGRYKVLRGLGAGGMAELFLARVDGVGGFSKLVALKRILPHKAANERFVRMLLNEAKLVASLDHPNIAQVHDIGQEDGEYFFAMEYVHGADLRHVLHEAPEHRLALENALHIAIGVCAGLHHAHEARDSSGRSLDIVHRDVSPSNVLVSFQGGVKLVDFGVAKASTVISETREGIIKGKYGYMSPEQCLGAPLDRRSDLFAVGILLWEMTVGRRLYRVTGDLATLQRVVYVDAPRPSRFVPDYPPALERIVMRALARDVDKRYQTGEQLQLELEAFALEYRMPVSPVTMSIQMRQLFRKRVAAWQADEAAGKSLADHLVTVAPEPEIVSSDEGAAIEISDVIDQLAAIQDDTQLARPRPLAETAPAPALRPSIVANPKPPSGELSPAPATATMSPVTRFEVPHPLVAPRPPRPKLLPLILVLVVIATFATLWLLLHRG
jgi:serine/threonine protein kinase